MTESERFVVKLREFINKENGSPLQLPITLGEGEAKTTVDLHALFQAVKSAGLPENVRDCS